MYKKKQMYKKKNSVNGTEKVTVGESIITR